MRLKNLPNPMESESVPGPFRIPTPELPKCGMGSGTDPPVPTVQVYGLAMPAWPAQTNALRSIQPVTDGLDTVPDAIRSGRRVR